MSSKRQKDNVEVLLDLIKDNPDLEIVPMVANEVCGGDDFGSWMGSWGSAHIDEVYHLDERIYFRSTDEDELIENKADYIFFEEYPNHKYLNDEESEIVNKQAEDYVKDLPWEEVIVVKINTP